MPRVFKRAAASRDLVRYYVYLVDNGDKRLGTAPGLISELTVLKASV